MKLSIKTALVLGITLIGVSCTTNNPKRISQVEPGMDKNQVLAIVGDPKFTQRVKGTDEWIYEYYKDNKKNFSKIVFKYGDVLKVDEYVPYEQQAEETFEEYKARVKSDRKKRLEGFKAVK